MNKKILMYSGIGLVGLILVCCIAAMATGTTPSKVEPTVTITNTVEQPTATRIKEATPTSTIEPTATLANTPVESPTNTAPAIIVVTKVVPSVSKPKATGIPQSDVIICKDGYVWPSKVRRGACHGHGGIRN